LIPDKNYPSFLSYVDMVADLDPYELRDRTIEKLRQIAFDWSEPGTVVPDAPPAEALLADPQTYLAWLKITWQDHDHMDFYTDLYEEAHALLNEPPAMQELIVSHMRHMWSEVIEPEWKRNLPILQESVEAFQKLDYSGLTLYEAIRGVVGRDLRTRWG